MSYNIIADYFEAAEGKNLPFKVELDVPNCLLDPNQHEKQKFSYIVTAVGSDGNSYADLECIVFGIDEKITSSQIQNVAVVINGKNQNVKFNKNQNDNVILVSPDENTGCKGLKFEFALRKTNDVMKISFELSEAYEVGTVPICLYGEGIMKTGLTIGGPKSDIYDQDDEKDTGEVKDPDDKKDSDNEKEPSDDKLGEHGEWFDTPVCDETACKVFDVYVPVSIKPYAHVYKPEVKCLDRLEILSGCVHCDKEYESCDFTITQKITVNVPVKYGILAYYDRICIENEEPEEEHEYKE